MGDGPRVGPAGGVPGAVSRGTHQEVTMPVYDYECRKCGHEFQVVERMSKHEKARHACPKCKSKAVTRVLTGTFVKTQKKS